MTPAHLLTPPGASGTLVPPVADIERFWPSRRADAFDEHCR